MRTRLQITTNDIQKITGQSDRSARAMLRACKDSTNKKIITFSLFCIEYGLNPMEVMQVIPDAFIPVSMDMAKMAKKAS